MAVLACKLLRCLMLRLFNNQVRTFVMSPKESLVKAEPRQVAYPPQPPLQRRGSLFPDPKVRLY